MILRESVYDHPSLYDVLFSDSCKREVEFLVRKFLRYNGEETGAILEPACGTGRLLWRLGKLGFQTAGLDLNSKALAFCNRRLRRHGLPETAIRGDMTDFTFEMFRRKKPFDMAFNLVSSFLHLTTENAALDHLAAVAGALKSGGIYVLGLHLLPRGKAACSSEFWRVRHGSLTVESSLRRRELDRRKRLETVEFRIRGITPKRNYEVVDAFSLRTYTVGQFMKLLDDSGTFDILETYDFSFDAPIRPDSRTEDVVFLLRKKSTTK